MEGLYKNKNPKYTTNVTVIGFSEELGVVKYRFVGKETIDDKTSTIDKFLTKYEKFEAPEIPPTLEDTVEEGFLYNFSMLVRFVGGRHWMPITKVARTEQEAVDLAEESVEENIDQTKVLGFTKFGPIEDGMELSLN